ncbi:MAG: molybdopterin oxidoreductase family protein, partial [Gammaproteobacteria bacterium]|nr:molybdopterin oxidoreductase family protein [Gammaproteobacteria bacterium]
RSNNSWMHNSRRLVKGKTRCDAMLNPADAERLAVSDGELVFVSSDAGTICLPVNITDDVMPGVVSIPHGWGHGRKGVRLAVAQRHAGVSVNDVIGTQSVEMLTGMAVLNGVPVEIRKA